MGGVREMRSKGRRMRKNMTCERKEQKEVLIDSYRRER